MTARALRFAVAVLAAVPVLSGCSSSPADAPRFFAATAPAPALAVSGQTCGIPSGPGAGRRIASDASGTVYVAAPCGGVVHAAASRDGAKTFGAPVATGLVNASYLTVQGGPAGVAYLVATTPDGLGGSMVTFTRTTDSGASWEWPRPLAPGATVGTAIAVRGEDVFIQVHDFGKLTVLRNASRGAGTFAATALPVGPSPAYSGLFVDSAGTLWSGFDTPDLYLSSSSDGGGTFTDWTPIPGAHAFYSTWAIGADVIWVAGSPLEAEPGQAHRISVASPTVATPVSGLVAPDVSMETSLAADDDGTAYYAAGGAAGVVLQRALASAVSFGEARTIDALGRKPSLLAPGDVRTVLVAYERDGQIWTTVQVY